MQEFNISNSENEKNALQLELKNIILGDFTKILFTILLFINFQNYI
jgi:hypothetical protein